MKKWLLLVGILLPFTAFSAETVHLHIKANGDAEAQAAAKKGYDYWKAQGAQQIRPAPRQPARSSDKRKQSLYFPESFSGYALSENNELLKISRGEVVQRMKVRPSIKRIAIPEVDDEVLTGDEAEKPKRTERKPPQ